MDIEEDSWFPLNKKLKNLPPMLPIIVTNSIIPLTQSRVLLMVPSIDSQLSYTCFLHCFFFQSWVTIPLFLIVICTTFSIFPAHMTIDLPRTSLTNITICTLSEHIFTRSWILSRTSKNPFRWASKSKNLCKNIWTTSSTASTVTFCISWKQNVKSIFKNFKLLLPSSHNLMIH